ncbi:hypothetical protein FOZ63_006019 [Perkinsus olseni]|uniref:Uncharacterized protein n=1 Tax=Perkinsus olseni TaxID=32597 RepID=A0A7J6PSS1_PEROL|nr:hypothetical protein FOZ63_006019 [Perkinsus olseni]
MDPSPEPLLEPGEESQDTASLARVSEISFTPAMISGSQNPAKVCEGGMSTLVTASTADSTAQDVRPSRTSTGEHGCSEEGLGGDDGPDGTELGDDQSLAQSLNYVVDEYRRKKFFDEWDARSSALVRVEDFSSCRELPDGSAIVGRMWDIVDLDARRSSLTDYNKAVTMNLSQGCSGPWDIDFDQLRMSMCVQLTEEMNDFPLKLSSGIHISKLIEMMYTNWKSLLTQTHKIKLTRQEIEDTEKAFHLIINNFPAILRNKMSFKVPNYAAFQAVTPGEAYNLVVMMETIAASNRASNVVPKTAVTLLRGFRAIFLALPQSEKSFEGLLKTFKDTTGGQGVEKSNRPILKALFEEKKCIIDEVVLHEMVLHEATISSFDNNKALNTTFTWEVLNALFRNDWSRSLSAGEASPRARLMIDNVHKFFDVNSETTFVMHRMVGENSLLKQEDGSPFDAEGLRRYMLSIVAGALGQGGKLKVYGRSKSYHKSDVLQMKFACVMWMIFKAHPAMYAAIQSLPHDYAKQLLMRLRSKEADITTILSSYAIVFTEGLHSDACSRTRFEEIDPAKIFFPAKEIMSEIYSKKDEESRKEEMLREKKEQAEREQHLALIAEAEKQRKAANDELKRMKQEKMNADQSRFDLIVQQSIETTLAALQESKKKCEDYKKQVDSDLKEAAHEILDERVLVADFQQVPKRSSSSSASTDLATGGSPSLPCWISEALRSLRTILGSSPPDLVYVDCADDKYMNGSDYSSCSIPISCKDKQPAEHVELFMREIVEHFLVNTKHPMTIILRTPTSSPSGISTALQLLCSFSSHKERQNMIPKSKPCEESEDSVLDMTRVTVPADDPRDVALKSPVEQDGSSVTSEKRISYRLRNYWDIGYPIEISLKEQYVQRTREKLKALRKRDREAAEVRLCTAFVAPENLYMIQRSSKGSPGRRRLSVDGSKEELSPRERAFKQLYREDEKRAVLVGEKDDPLSAGSSDLSLRTFVDLFSALGVKATSKVLIVCPGENNCNSILAAAGRLGCSVVLPLRVAKLVQYPALYNALTMKLTEGLRKREFLPCKKIPVRPVTEEIDFLLGARRQAILLTRGVDNPMTKEEEQEYEVTVLHTCEALIPAHLEVHVKLDLWREDPLVQANTRLRRLESDNAVQAVTLKAFDSHVHSLTRSDASWLYLKEPVVEGQEVFRLDGFTHCSTRAESVIDVICARTGQPREEALECDDVRGRKRRKRAQNEGSLSAGHRAQTCHDFPPASWQIIKATYSMPAKIYDWAKEGIEAKSLEDAPQTRTGAPAANHTIECGKLFIYGSTDDFEGLHVLKDETQFEGWDDAKNCRSAFADPPLALKVNSDDESVFSLVATRPLFKGDLLWICKSPTHSVQGSRTATSSQPSTPEKNMETVDRRPVKNARPPHRERASDPSGTELDPEIDLFQLAEEPVSVKEVCEGGKATVKRKGNSAKSAAPAKSVDVTRMAKLSTPSLAPVVSIGKQSSKRIAAQVASTTKAKLKKMGKEVGASASSTEAQGGRTTTGKERLRLPKGTKESASRMLTQQDGMEGGTHKHKTGERQDNAQNEKNEDDEVHDKTDHETEESSRSDSDSMYMGTGSDSSVSSPSSNSDSADSF